MLNRLFCAALLVCAPVTFSQTLHRSGPAADRLDLVILADGYRAGDRADFEDDADRVLEALRSTEPFASYMSLMNVHRGFRASGSSGSSADNAYGTQFSGGFFSPRLRASRVTLLLADAVRAGGEADAVLVILNASRRGGTATGNTCYVSSGAGPRVALHELGHAIGRLGDEYSSFSGTPTLTRAQLAQIYPNLTTESTRGRLPWSDWVASSTRVPATLFTGGVSAYAGGGAYSNGIYRPRRACRMRTDTPGYCEVCRQHLVVAIHRRANPLRLQVTGSGSSRRARLVGSMPDGTWATRWSGVQAQGLEARVPAGVNASVVVEDRTPWVRGSDLRTTLRSRFDARTGAGGPVAGGAPGQVGRVVGVSTRLRVRQRPSTASTILGHLLPGATVQVLGPAEGGFYPIAWNGGTGYVGRNFVSLQSSAVGLTSVVGRWR